MPKKRRQIEVPQHWTTFAWQGFSVRVPPEWTPASLTGGEDEGYFRIDGPDQPRVEAKWATSRGFVDVDGVVRKYFRTLTRGRAGKDVKIREKVKLSVPMPKERSSVKTFGWRGEQEALGVAWYCRECGRVTLVQVLGRPGEDLQALAEKILSTFRDHTDGQWRRWALYELDCQVPKDFKLVSQEYLTGLLRLSFERGRDKLTIVRWGLANVALKSTSLKNWLMSKNRKAWRPFNVRLEEEHIHGHQGLAISGESAVPFMHLFGVGVRLLGRRWPTALRGAAWVCEQGNKIYHVEAVIDPSEEGMIAEVIYRLRCHREAGSSATADK